MRANHVRAAYELLLVSLAVASASHENLTSKTHHRRRRREQATRTLLGMRRSMWQPKRTHPCNSTGFIDRPHVSALVQAFRDGANARQLAQRLHLLPSVEVIVNDDSGRDHAEWLRWLGGTNDAVVSSANVHEIRAYHRMARMARGEYLLLLQGDHCLPAHGSAWLEKALALFDAFPKLGLLGGQMGFNQVPTRRIAEKISWGVSPCTPIPTAIPTGAPKADANMSHIQGLPFMFVAGVNIGPLLARREAFLQVGGFDEAFSCPGEPGIQLDTELSLQMWAHGYQVGLWYSGVSNGVGGRKTRTNRVQKRARTRNDAINAERCERVMQAHDARAVAAANHGLRALGKPTEARAREYSRLGLRDPARCDEMANR